MGLYYTTVFVDGDKEILLAQLDPIIDSRDTNQGYVDAHELASKFPETKGHITISSKVVEYLFSTYDGGRQTINRSLPVRGASFEESE
jgi:hypothetical protein